MTTNAIQNPLNGLEPYWSSDIDGFAEKIKPKLTPKQMAFFEGCRFKVKALWYIRSQIIKHDTRYKEAIDKLIEQKNFSSFERDLSFQDERYKYFPFFEAIDFENLLFQGKATLDLLAKAIGSVFKQCPNNLDSLEKVLSNDFKSNLKAKSVLGALQKVEDLKGLTADPKEKNKKSIRDVITHSQRIDLYFWIFRDEKGDFFCSKGAILDRDDRHILFSNYLAERLATDIWYYTADLFKASFAAIVDIE